MICFVPNYQPASRHQRGTADAEQAAGSPRPRLSCTIDSLEWRLRLLYGEMERATYQYYYSLDTKRQRAPAAVIMPLTPTHKLASVPELFNSRRFLSDFRSRCL